jgi:hypothetical protein
LSNENPNKNPSKDGPFQLAQHAVARIGLKPAWPGARSFLGVGVRAPASDFRHPTSDVRCLVLDVRYSLFGVSYAVFAVALLRPSMFDVECSVLDVRFT